MDQQYSVGLNCCNKRKLEDAHTSSVFSMTLSSSLESIPPPEQTTCGCPTSNYQMEAFLSASLDYQNLSIKQILDDCCLDGDANLASVALVPYSDPVLDCQDIEWDQLEDDFIMGAGSTDEIPVAAALVSILEDSANYSHTQKRICLQNDNNYDQENLSGEENRFRDYQTGQWHDRFQELLLFRQAHGHCLVPHTFRENLPLARWVKRQRYQYKLMKQGDPTSSMSNERAKMLNDVGFVWSSQAAVWSERLEELREYRHCFGHSNVPSSYVANPKLATWVKCQRRQWKLFLEQKPSNITLERIQLLNELGFEWELRNGKGLPARNFS